MATLNIEGKRVTVDDSFLKLSPEQQAATVDEISHSLGAKPAEAGPEAGGPSKVGDTAAGGAVGLLKGLLGLPPAVGAARAPARVAAAAEGKPTPATPSDPQQALEAVTGPLYEPKTGWGHAAETVGEFAPGALMTPGGVLSRVGYGVAAPAIGALAGEAPLPDSLKPVGRVAGALISGVSAPAIGNRVARALTSVPEELNHLSGGARRVLADTHQPGTTEKLADLGPDAFMFEGNPGTFQLTQGVAIERPGAAQARVIEGLTQRDKGANARIRADVETNAGPYREPGGVAARIDEEIAQTSKRYTAVAGAAQQRLDVKPIIRELDEAITTEAGASQKALKEAKDYFYRPERIDNADGSVSYGKKNDVLKSEVYDLHRVRMALDDLHDKLADTPRAQGLIVKLRQQLDKLMPEPMKEVDRVVADLHRQKEALNIGQGKILRTGPEAMTPEGLQALEASGGPNGGRVSPGQADMLKAGTRADIERLVGTNANDVQALRKAVGGDGDWNRTKLASIFGEAEADRIIKAVDREVAFKEAVTKIRDNAQTAHRLGAAEYLKKNMPDEGKPIPPFWERVGQAPEYAVRKAGGALRDWAGGAARSATNDELADVLMRTGPERDRVVGALADYTGRINRRAPPMTASRIAELLATNAGLAANSSR